MIGARMAALLAGSADQSKEAEEVKSAKEEAAAARVGQKADQLFLVKTTIGY